MLFSLTLKAATQTVARMNHLDDRYFKSAGVFGHCRVSDEFRVRMNIANGAWLS